MPPRTGASKPSASNRGGSGRLAPSGAMSRTGPINSSRSTRNSFGGWDKGGFSHELGRTASRGRSPAGARHTDNQLHPDQRMATNRARYDARSLSRGRPATGRFGRTASIGRSPSASGGRIAQSQLHPDRGKATNHMQYDAWSPSKGGVAPPEVGRTVSRGRLAPAARSAGEHPHFGQGIVPSGGQDDARSPSRGRLTTGNLDRPGLQQNSLRPTASLKPTADIQSFPGASSAPIRGSSQPPRGRTSWHQSPGLMSTGTARQDYASKARPSVPSQNNFLPRNEARPVVEPRLQASQQPNTAPYHSSPNAPTGVGFTTSALNPSQSTWSNVQSFMGHEQVQNTYKQQSELGRGSERLRPARNRRPLSLQYSFPGQDANSSNTANLGRTSSTSGKTYQPVGDQGFIRQSGNTTQLQENPPNPKQGPSKLSNGAQSGQPTSTSQKPSHQNEDYNMQQQTSNLHLNNSNRISSTTVQQPQKPSDGWYQTGKKIVKGTAATVTAVGNIADTLNKAYDDTPKGRAEKELDEENAHALEWLAANVPQRKAIEKNERNEERIEKLKDHKEAWEDRHDKAKMQGHYDEYYKKKIVDKLKDDLLSDDKQKAPTSRKWAYLCERQEEEANQKDDKEKEDLEQRMKRAQLSGFIPQQPPQQPAFTVNMINQAPTFANTTTTAATVSNPVYPLDQVDRQSITSNMAQHNNEHTQAMKSQIREVYTPIRESVSGEYQPTTNGQKLEAHARLQNQQGRRTRAIAAPMAMPDENLHVSRIANHTPSLSSSKGSGRHSLDSQSTESSDISFEAPDAAPGYPISYAEQYAATLDKADSKRNDVEPQGSQPRIPVTYSTYAVPLNC